MTDSVRFVRCIVFTAALVAAGCERLGIEDPAKAAAASEAEGKAIGAGCRHAGRSLEDCYALNDRAVKAAVFAGWKEMNDYMASNKIEVVPSQLAQASAPEAAAAPDPKLESKGQPAKAAKPAPATTEKH